MSGSRETLPDVAIDASVNPCCWLACFPFTCGALPYKTELQLGPEEVARVDVNLCGQNVSRRPYGELGSVDRGKCLCCVTVISGFGEISPGCGCEPYIVDEIVNELTKRMRDRGDTAQIQRAEETIERLSIVENKLDLIMDHLNIPKPEKDMDRFVAIDPCCERAKPVACPSHLILQSPVNQKLDPLKEDPTAQEAEDAEGTVATIVEEEEEKKDEEDAPTPESAEEVRTPVEEETAAPDNSSRVLPTRSRFLEKLYAIVY